MKYTFFCCEKEPFIIHCVYTRFAPPPITLLSAFSCPPTAYVLKKSPITTYFHISFTSV